MFGTYSRCQLEKVIGDLKEVLLTNLVMLSEIPAPTFDERRRGEMLLERFTQAKLEICSQDEINNVIGLIPGSNQEASLLLVAHLDSDTSASVDHTATITPEDVIGADIGDNALGLAVLATLPSIFAALDYQPNYNIILLGAARSLGRGDLEGISFFLDNSSYPIHAGLCLEGVMLGRLSHSSLGMLRGELVYETPDEYDWSRFDAAGALCHMNTLINQILAIPLPSSPRSSIALTAMEAGSGFTTPHTARLRLEVRSESAEIVRQVGTTINDIAEEAAFKTQALVTFKQRALRTPGGLAFKHPLTVLARSIMAELGIVPRIGPSTSDLAAFIHRQIPALTLGITEGSSLDNDQDLLKIAPMTTGLVQVVAMLLQLDQRKVSWTLAHG